MKKIKNLLMLAIAAMSLSGCDGLFGGDEDDTTIYHTTIVIDGVPAETISSNNYKVIAVPYVDDGDDVVPGETQYNEVDATYQTRVDLTAPFIPGYKFLGWDLGDGNLVGLGDDTPEDGYYHWWNQAQQNGTIKAKYQLWTYTIQYCFDDDSTQSAPEGSLTQYNVTMGEKLLSPAKTSNANKEEFVQWSMYKRTNGQATKVKIEKLPTDFFEDHLQIYGDFRTKKYNVTLNLEEGVSDVVSLTLANEKYNDGSANPQVEKVSENNWNIDYGFNIYFIANFIDSDAVLNFYATVDGGSETFLGQQGLTDEQKTSGDKTIFISYGDFTVAKSVTLRLELF